MIIKIEVPQLSNNTVSFPRHWMNVTLLNNRPTDYRVHAIVSNYVRLVEAAYSQYELARLHLNAFWNTHHAIAMTDFHLSGTHFESCINSMHRAILCIRQMRGGNHVPNEIKALIPTKPNFLSEPVAKKLRRFRDMAQHMEEKVLKGGIPKGTPFSLRADGPETPVLDSDQPNQTLKSIDRLTLGGEELLISELVNWLSEMHLVAKAVSEYEQPSSPNATT